MKKCRNCRNCSLVPGLVGPNPRRFATLVSMYPEMILRATVDQRAGAEQLSMAMVEQRRTIPTLVDLDVGMGRTGIEPGDLAFELCRLVERLAGLSFDGFHVYDGHVHDRELEDRRRSADAAFEPVLALRDRLAKGGQRVARLVVGGTPTFPIHTDREIDGLECSPGTCIFHDAGYAARFPDMKFDPAAMVFTRIISKPRKGRICLDVGYKAVAGDPPSPRIELLGLDDYAIGPQSEEHLIVDAQEADDRSPGDWLLAIPKHICPTCAMHKRAYVIEAGKLVDEWDVLARDRVLEC